MKTPILPLAVLVVLLSSCGQKPDQPVPTTSPATEAVQQEEAIVEQVVEQPSETAPNTDSGKPALRPDQSLDGVIEVDLGDGPVRMFSIAHTITAEMAARSGAPELADLVGTTQHESNMDRIGDELHVDLVGRGRGLGTIMLGLVLDSDTLALNRGIQVSFLPAGLTEHYICDAYGDCPEPVFELEHAEYNADGSVALAGTFSAQELPPHQTSESLAGTTLGPVQGRFDFEVVAIYQ